MGLTNGPDKYPQEYPTKINMNQTPNLLKTIRRLGRASNPRAFIKQERVERF